MKLCTQCHQILPLTSFAKRSKDSHLLQSQCKNCSHEALRERRRKWRDNMPEGQDTKHLQPLIMRPLV